MKTLNLFESNLWDCFYEINVLKSVNKLYFCQKMGKFGFLYLICLQFKSGKILRTNFPR